MERKKKPRAEKFTRYARNNRKHEKKNLTAAKERDVVTLPSLISAHFFPLISAQPPLCRPSFSSSFPFMELVPATHLDIEN
jgi:hypothetical protein